MKQHVLKQALACLVASSLAQPLWAQEQADSDTETGTATAEATAASDGTQSGYDDIKEFGGPESVGVRLKENDEDREAEYMFDNLQRGMRPYFDWKRGINDDHGVSFGTSFYVLYQNASDALDGEDDNALGYVFRQQGTWNIFSRDNGNSGRISWRFESRSQIGSYQAPGSLGGATGIRTLAPGFAYNEEFDFDIPVLSWVQHFASGRAGYAVGRLAFDAYLDAFPFQTLSKGSMNRSTILNTTMPTTGLGALGAVVKGFVTDNIWLGAQFHDANAANGEFDFDTIGEGEFIKAVEVGYTPSIDRRNTHRIQLTVWEKDARDEAGTPKGQGWAVSAAWQLNDKYFPYVRYGDSDGGGGVAAEQALAVGVQISTRRNETWTINAGWSKPSSETFGPGLDDESVFEMSYQFQLSKNFSLTPNFQMIFNPAGNPGEDSINVFGVRAILTL